MATFHLLLIFANMMNCSLQVGLTPLHLAAESGHKELVGLLVASYKASVDALTLVSVCVLILLYSRNNFARNWGINLSILILTLM